MRPTLIAIFGLALALLGPGLVAWLSKRSPAAETSVEASLPWLTAFAALVAAVWAIGVFAQRLGASDLGFGGTSLASLPLAIALTGFFIFVFGPLAAWALAKFNLGSFDAGASRFAGLPGCYLALTIIVVAGSEEWLYRGYAIERLAALTGNVWLAGGISLLAFGLAHLPLWGIGVSLTTFVSGGILTALYIWRRDVAFLMLAHVLTDLYGFMLVSRNTS
jgi:membrane protease YdiL (CAAX protease family)